MSAHSSPHRPSKPSPLRKACSASDLNPKSAKLSDTRELLLELLHSFGTGSETGAGLSGLANSNPVGNSNTSRPSTSSSSSYYSPSSASSSQPPSRLRQTLARHSGQDRRLRVVTESIRKLSELGEEHVEEFMRERLFVSIVLTRAVEGISETERTQVLDLIGAEEAGGAAGDEDDWSDEEEEAVAEAGKAAPEQVPWQQQQQQAKTCASAEKESAWQQAGAGSVSGSGASAVERGCYRLEGLHGHVDVSRSVSQTGGPAVVRAEASLPLETRASGQGGEQQQQQQQQLEEEWEDLFFPALGEEESEVQAGEQLFLSAVRAASGWPSLLEAFGGRGGTDGGSYLGLSATCIREEDEQEQQEQDGGLQPPAMQLSSPLAPMPQRFLTPLGAPPNAGEAGRDPYVWDLKYLAAHCSTLV